MKKKKTLAVGDKIRILVDGAWGSELRKGSVQTVIGFGDGSAKLASGWFAPMTPDEFEGEGKVL